MTRLTEHDRHFGPLTWGRTHWTKTRFSLDYLSSGGGEHGESPKWNSIVLYALGWIVRLWMPNLIGPHRIRHYPKDWDAETVKRLGRNYYDECFTREYGFSIFDGLFTIHYGAQTFDSSTTKSWSKFISWTQWRHVRYSLFTPQGHLYWTQYDRDQKRGLGMYDEQHKQKDACPKVHFEFDDYDGKRIMATCHIEEREWRFGVGWFKWLSLFRKPRIRRDLELQFSEEVGPEKGSWKGGTVGHGTEMLPGESCEAAFRRYCEQKHRSKYRDFQIQFVGATNGC